MSSSKGGGKQKVNQISHGVASVGLEYGWNWNSRAGSSSSSVQDGPGSNRLHHKESHPVEDDDIDDDDGSDVVDSGDELLSDDLDSDASDQSFESWKKNKMLKDFFSNLDKLTMEEFNKPTKEWHCPACRDGPGETVWYKGLQPLITHARTKGSRRVKLHRELAELLKEELRRRGTSVEPVAERFGKWEGLNDSIKDREIIWPPMVVIMNTKLEQNENDKWIGMGNPELRLSYFSSYDTVKARHSYGPHGHQGMSMLIFESSAIGYLEAKDLHKRFKEQGTDRKAWDHHRLLFKAGGDHRQLYGFMAKKQDLEIFNQHSQGKSRLKYETRSYQETVLSQLKQMHEDNQQLIWHKEKAEIEKRHSKAIKESFELVSAEMRKKDEENRILRQRSRLHHQQNKEAMDSQEDFYKNMHAAMDATEDNFERLQQGQKVKLLNAIREEDIQNFKGSQCKNIEEFVEKRDKLMKIHEEKKAALEKQFHAELNSLIDKDTLNHSQ